MASSVSFCMMPKMRSGKACSSASGNTFSSDADEGEERPQAPRERDGEADQQKKQMSPTEHDQGRGVGKFHGVCSRS